MHTFEEAKHNIVSAQDEQSFLSRRDFSNRQLGAPSPSHCIEIKFDEIDRRRAAAYRKVY